MAISHIDDGLRSISEAGTRGIFEEYSRNVLYSVSNAGTLRMRGMFIVCRVSQ